MKTVKRFLRSKWFLIPITGITLIVIYVNIILSFKGEVEKISFTGHQIQIEGLIIRPEGPGPHPGIVLLQGAGGSHQTYDKWYNRVHANALLKKGFAVLIYTKRGSGNNNIDYSYFTYSDLMKDAVAAVAFFRSQKDIDPDNIGLMGLSESGWYSPEVAARDGRIKFIINRVSSPFSVAGTIVHEEISDARNAGFTDQEIEHQIVPLSTRIWQFYIDVARDPSVYYSEVRDSINTALAQMQRHDRLKKWFVHDELEPYDSLRFAAKGQNYAYDPMPYINALNVPMLYILAGQDVNIPTKQVAEFFKEYKLRQQKDISLKIFPDAGHYLYRWKAVPVEGLYEPGYLDLVANWAAQQVQ